MDVVVTGHVKMDSLEPMLRDIGLKGNPDIKPYRDATIKLAHVHPDRLMPTAKYVSRELLAVQEELTKGLAQWDYDLYDLHGLVEYKCPCRRCKGLNRSECATCRGEGWQRWGMLPPVVEISRERFTFERGPFIDIYEGIPGPTIEYDFPIIADGMHRLWQARQDGKGVTVLWIEGADREWPYYRYPSTWDAVKVVDDRPQDEKDRGASRVHGRYKLYRDFTPLGVSGPRSAT